MATTASAALLLSGCGSDSADGEVKTSDDKETTKGSSGNSGASDALSRLEAAKFGCDSDVTLVATMSGEPFMEFMLDGETTRMTVAGDAAIRMMMSLFGGSDEDMAELDAIGDAFDSTIIVDGDTVYTSLVEDGEEVWYAVPADEYDAIDDGMSADVDFEELCEGNADDLDPDEYAGIYVDPDDDDTLILIPADTGDEFGFDVDTDDAEEETTTTAAAKQELSDDELRDVRDNGSRVLVKLDGDRIQEMDMRVSEMGMSFEMKIEADYGDVTIEIPSDAKKVSGDEWAEISEAHSARLDEQFGSLFGFGDLFSEEMFEEGGEFDFGAEDLTEEELRELLGN